MVPRVMRSASLAVVLSALALVGWPPPALAAIITVNSTDDVIAPADGHCTLREAILAANSNTPSGVVPGECATGTQGLDTIVFQIAGAGVRTIALASELPAFSEAITIDGYTQPGASANTLAAGNNAVLLVELDGTNAGPGAYAFKLASGSTVRGLVINRFKSNNSGNGGSGFLLNGESDCVITGNFIGTNATGTAALSNEGLGVFLLSASPDNRIGGTAPGDRNVISGNLHGAIALGNAGTTGNVVQGNYIGTDAAGTVAIANSPGGITINAADSNVIGGTTPGAGNLISGNAGYGVAVVNVASGNVIQGNLIGTAPAGTWGIPNASGGIIVASGGSGAGINTQIGGTDPGAGNIIAFNGGPGVTVQSSQLSVPIGNAILGNSIFSNAGLGIDLVDTVMPAATGGGPTSRAARVARAGPNNNQPPPVLTSASVSAAGAQIAGMLTAAPSALYRVELFANSACDPSGSGEGRTFLGATPLLTDSGGTRSFDLKLTALTTGEQFVTATATDAAGNTSEFSACVAVSAPPATTLVAAVLPGSRSVRIGRPATAFATIINTGGDSLACGIAATTPLFALFAYQTTDPHTNALTGTLNTPVNLDAGASQSFVVAFTPHAAFPPTAAAMAFQCLNSAPAPVAVGLNTLLLSASNTPVPDIIALSLTPSGDGTAHLPGSNGAVGFAVATSNVGATATITASVDTGTASPPLVMGLCLTDPITATCVNPVSPAASVTIPIAAGGTPTFAVFLQALGEIAFDPANSRVFVRFKDDHDNIRGETSVAVTTQ